VLICLVGFGNIYLGLFLGFRELQKQDLLKKSHVYSAFNLLFAVLFTTLTLGKHRLLSRIVQTGTTLAEGIAAERPIRGQMILDAIRFTNGAFTTVDETDITTGLKTLATKGIYVEPTSAVVVKAYDKFTRAGIIRKGALTISILTGIGLKATHTVGS